MQVIDFFLEAGGRAAVGTPRLQTSRGFLFLEPPPENPKHRQEKESAVPAKLIVILSAATEIALDRTGR